MKKCKFCGKEIESYNKHRTSCKECKENHPYKESQKNEKPFNRRR